MDSPDDRRESQFHQIYKAYNSNPTSEQSWKGVSAGKAQNYQIQKGDTLWDLSTTLFGQGDFWPKVWSLNNEKVQNPHEILPLQSIQFFPGTLGEAPQVLVTDAADSNGQEVSTSEVSAVKLVGNPNPADLPERLRKPTPVAGLPDSLPNWGFRKAIKVDTEFDMSPRKPLPQAQESLTYFVSAGFDQVLGEISETEFGGKTAADFQYIFVKLENPLTEKMVLAVKDMGEISDPVEGNKAHLIEAQGEIEILDLVNSEKSIYRALVKRTMVPIEVGSKIVAGKIPSYDAGGGPVSSQAMARVVGGEFNIRRELFGNRGILFLSGQGMDLGQIYPIFKVHQKRVPGSQVSSNDRQIGRVKVIQVSGGFATALVLDSKEDIEVGDITNPDVRMK